MFKLFLIILAAFVSGLLGWAFQQQESERRLFMSRQATIQQAQIEGLINTTNELKNSVNDFWMFINEKEGRIGE